MVTLVTKVDKLITVVMPVYGPLEFEISTKP